MALGCALAVLIWMSSAVAEPLYVMTFNLRFAHPSPNSWAERRPVVRALLEREAPDLLGTQEGVHAQISDLEKDLPAYDWIGEGREGGQNGEYMAIFYRRDRFHPVEHDHFWLSDTPEVAGSRSWGNRIPRMVTWARLRSPGKCEFYVVNTHFDHEAQLAREKSADLVIEQTKKFDPTLPVVLLGDFNAAAGANPVHAKLTAPGAFIDTWRELDKPEPRFGTFHDFKGEAGAGNFARIDWILTRGAARTLSTEILTYAHGDQYPSDHFPVVARIELGKCR
jgi:endonuclease/exonuclease/phosphatase family metal-dependent hydrolase